MTPDGSSRVGAERLLLKWGTLKGWEFYTDASVAAANKYASFGMSAGCAQQRDSAEQKEVLCELIDVLDGEIKNDWTGEVLTKEQAKEYVREYRR